MSKTTEPKVSLDPTKDDFDYQTSPFYNLARVISLYHQRLDAALKPVGMDVARWRILTILEKHEPATVTKLSTETMIRISTIAKLVQRMTAEGLVDTRPSTGDARSTDVFLTELGREKMALVFQKARAIAVQACYDIEDGDLHAVNVITRKIFSNLNP